MPAEVVVDDPAARSLAVATKLRATSFNGWCAWRYAPHPLGAFAASGSEALAGRGRGATVLAVETIRQRSGNLIRRMLSLLVPPIWCILQRPRD